MQRDAAPVDPGDPQPERLAPDQVGELRLVGVEDLVLADCRMIDEVSEQRAVRLVALGTFGGADEVELAPQRRRREEVVIDIGDDREAMAPPQHLQRRQTSGYSWKLLKASK